MTSLDSIKQSFQKLHSAYWFLLAHPQDKEPDLYWKAIAKVESIADGLVEHGVPREFSVALALWGSDWIEAIKQFGT